LRAFKISFLYLDGMEAEEWPMAEILSIRTIDGGVNQYYVHFVDYNKRLDEWVNEDRLDTRKVEPPPLAKDDKTTGINTPIRRTVSLATSTVPSRPSSPPTPASSTFDNVVTGIYSLMYFFHVHNTRLIASFPLLSINRSINELRGFEAILCVNV
jgi:hypothetical protein